MDRLIDLCVGLGILLVFYLSYKREARDDCKEGDQP